MKKYSILKIAIDRKTVKTSGVRKYFSKAFYESDPIRSDRNPLFNFGSEPNRSHPKNC